MGIFRSVHSIASDIRAIRDVMEVQSKTLVTTPKSICSMTSVLEPRIARDFPEFSWREFRPDAERMIESHLRSMGASRIRFHRTEISNYERNGSNCLITLQSALEYIPSPEEDQKRSKKLRGQPHQARYSSELLYVQDRAAYGEEQTAAGVTCPNCGAPVTVLGQKKCEYCGSALTVINRHVWTLSRIYES